MLAISVDAIVAERQRRALGLHQRRVLLRECVLGLGHDPHEVLFRERLELDPDREPSLQLRDQIAGLRHVERAGRDEEHVIGLHHAVLGLDVGAFDDRQQIPLHAFARDVGPTAARRPALAGDLVDLVEEDDAELLDAFQRVARDVFMIDQLLQLLLHQDAACLGDFHRAAFLPLGAHLLEHLHEVLHPLGRALRQHDIPHLWAGMRDLDLDVAPLELSVQQELSQLRPRPLVARLRRLIAGAVTCLRFRDPATGASGPDGHVAAGRDDKHRASLAGDRMRWGRRRSLARRLRGGRHRR